MPNKQEFLEASAGCLTASEDFHTIATGTPGRIDKLILAKIEERKRGARESRAPNAAMRDGIYYEPLAIAALVPRMGKAARDNEWVFIPHPSGLPIGATPDVISAAAVGEVKCPKPKNADEQIRAVANRKLPAKWYWQLQGQMWVCGKTAGWFGVYDVIMGELTAAKFAPDKAAEDGWKKIIAVGEKLALIYKGNKI